MLHTHDRISNRSRATLWLLAVLGAMTLATLMPGRARGVTIDPNGVKITSGGGQLTVRATGEDTAQNLTVSAATGNNVVFEETGTGPVFVLEQSSLCDPVGTEVKKVSCSLAGVSRLDIDTGALNDRVTVASAGAESVTLPTELSGGTGDDRLTGGAGDDTLIGGGESDILKGGPGFDTMPSPGRTNPLFITVNDGLRNDGEALDETKAAVVSGSVRSRDDVADGIERFQLSTAGDDIVGSPAAETLEGKDGPDTLEGKGGADSFDGGNADDLIIARDGAADTSIVCGPGNDRVVADPQDPVNADCETVERGADALPPALQPVPGAQAGLTGAGGGTNGQTPPEVQIVGQIALVSNSGKAKVRVRCVYKAQACKGTLKLTSGGAATVKLGKKRKLKLKRGEKLAQANVNIPWGNSEPVTVKVSSKAVKLLKKLRKGIKTNAEVRATDSAATASSAAIGTAKGQLKLLRQAKTKK